MKGKTAFDALECIDHNYILEAAPDAPVRVVSKSRYLRVAAVAAALAVVVTVGAVMVPMLLKEPENPTGDNSPNISVEKVFSVSQTHYGATSLIPDEDADVSLKNVVSQDENRPNKDTFTFQGTDYDLSYQHSVFLPASSCSVHLFEIEGAEAVHLHDVNDSPYVRFYDDGSLADICNMNLGNIDLNNSDSDEYVIAAAETIATPYIDIGRYTNVERMRYSPGGKAGLVIWYNEVGGKRLPGSTFVAITEKGLVWAISIGMNYEFAITQEQLPTNEIITEIVKKEIVAKNLCSVDSVRDWLIDYSIIVFRGEVYAHTSVGFLYTEVLEDGTEQNKLGSLEYLIPITGANVSYGEQENQE